MLGLMGDGSPLTARCPESALLSSAWASVWTTDLVFNNRGRDMGWYSGLNPVMR
jgi:hypothetical protein